MRAATHISIRRQRWLVVYSLHQLLEILDIDLEFLCFRSRYIDGTIIEPVSRVGEGMRIQN